MTTILSIAQGRAQFRRRLVLLLVRVLAESVDGLCGVVCPAGLTTCTTMMQRTASAAALADDFAVADLVAAGLARPAAIAVDLAGHFLGLGAVALDEEGAALLAAGAGGPSSALFRLVT